MIEVVVLGWDGACRELAYVPVNGGAGGTRTSMVVAAWAAPDVDHECAGAELPQVGHLETDGDGCILTLTGRSVVQCSVRYRNGRIRLSDRNRQGVKVADLSPEAVGLGEPEFASRADEIGSFLWFGTATNGGTAGCWLVDGGLHDWLARQRAAGMQRRQEREAKAERDRALREKEEAEERAKGRFVNPYTFVPFPATIDRCKPAGHELLAEDRLSGSFTVRWEFTAPMQAPDGSVDGAELRLPGSSVKGAVRALHETLAGGCLRVLNEDFRPSYRDTASELSPQWTLATVTKVTADGQPLAVRPCERVVWVRAEQLRQAWGRELKTGCGVSLKAELARKRLDRYELPPDADVTRDGDWVVLLTDAGARPKQRNDPDNPTKKINAEYFAACGLLGTEAVEVSVSEDAWLGFRTAVDGAREVQQYRAALRNGVAWQPTQTVEFHGPIGRRKRVTGLFDVDDVLWVHRPAGSGEVDELRLSAIWRHTGEGPLRDRVPQALRPCTDPDRLCPSCRIFGSADHQARGEDETAQQRAYAGHVRFGDAVSPDPVRLTPFDRAPMGAPKPGAGQFYLAVRSTDPARTEKDQPTREWRHKKAEGGSQLHVRGRKFYWHADPTVQPVHRHIRRPDQTNEAMQAQRLLAPAGTVLHQRVTFDNLSEAELGGLLSTLQPQLVLNADAGRLLLRLGGAKPLGLGSCHAEVRDLRVWTARSRYGDATAQAPCVADYVAAFAGQCSPAVRQTWPALAAVLAEDSVDPKQVWYPPGARWDEQRAKAKDFDESFNFFTGSSGMFLKNGQRPILPLPDPTQPDQTLPIIDKYGKPLGAAE